MVRITTPICPPSLDQLRSAVGSICQKHAVARLEVFGSVAQGKSRVGSDLDFLVEFLPEANIGLFEMGELQEELEEQLRCPIDLLTRRAVESSRNLIRRRVILANPVTIYAR